MLDAPEIVTQDAACSLAEIVAPLRDIAFTAPSPLNHAILSTIRLLFDRSFYLSRHPEARTAGLDPLDHFLTVGLAAGHSPCPLFDAAFYRSQPGVPAGCDALFVHYLTVGVPNRLDPHPLVEAAFYARQEPCLPTSTDPLVHLLGAGRRENRRPNRLFDPAFYLARQPEAANARHPLIHYALRGWHSRTPTHPLFDPETYLAERPEIAKGGVPTTDPLAHYLRHGRLSGARAHWMFDAELYVAGDRDSTAFDPAHDIDPGEALLHCAEHGAGACRSPHMLFDAAYYMRNAPDVAAAGADPFLHFLQHGLAEGRDPHPLFDSTFYANRYPDVAQSQLPPFLHFLRHGIEEERDPNGFFPVARYLDRHPEAAVEPLGALGHYLRNEACRSERVSDAFDPLYYADANPDLRGSALTPLGHYLAYGRAEGRPALAKPLDDQPWCGAATHPGGLPVLLISHDASRTGAPVCALNALRTLAGDIELSPRVVLFRGGPLQPQFEAMAPTLTLADGLWPDSRRAALAEVLHSFRRDAPDGLVIVNTVTVPEAVEIAGLLGLKLIVWVHEMPVLIDSVFGGAATMAPIARHATRILTVSAAARDALVARYDLPADRIDMLSNGVVLRSPDDTADGDGARSVARRAADRRQASLSLRESLGLPPDALIVLGCGSVGFHKGTDLFIEVARRVVPLGARHAQPDGALRQAYFLWLGDLNDRMFAGLCQHDIDRLGLSDRVRLLGQQEDPDRFMQGADLFLMPSRVESFGLAGLEAGLSGLPVIGFEGCGAAPQMARLGLTEIAYLDVDAMVEAVVRLGDRPARRTRRPPETGREAGRRRLAPSWEQWHQGLRALLTTRLDVPLATMSRQAEAA